MLRSLYCDTVVVVGYHHSGEPYSLHLQGEVTVSGIGTGKKGT
jgi:hypothetical protein